MKYISTKKLFESPDGVHFAGKTYFFRSEGTRPFSVIMNKETKKLIDVVIGKLKTMHGQNTKTDPYTYKDSKNKIIYPGRLFFTPKIISFWEYPTGDELHFIILKLEKKLGKKLLNNEWKIETYPDAPRGQKRTYNRDYGFLRSEYITIEEYIKKYGTTHSKNPPTAEYLQHLDTSKKHEVPFGYGSKNPAYQSKRQWQMASVTDESKEEKLYPKLFESPDEAVNPQNNNETVGYQDVGAYPFGYYNDKLYIGEESETHDDIVATTTEDDYFTASRHDLKYSGRIWTKEKLISFWDFPKNKVSLQKIIKDLDDYFRVLDFKNDDWYIEVVGPKGTKNILLKNYIGSVSRSKEEMNIQHLDTKHKHEVPFGYGSKNPAYQSKRQWQMASVTDESKEEDLYPKLFENPNAIYVGQFTGGMPNIVTLNTDINDVITFGYNTEKTELFMGYGDVYHNDFPIFRGPCSGRIFRKYKIITFWMFPENAKELFKFLHDLEEKTDIKFDSSWKIEIPVNSQYEKEINNKNGWGSWYPHEDDIKYISIDDYTKPFRRSKEELAIKHLIPPGAGKKEVPMGYGSKNPKYQEKRQWQMAMATEEGKEEELYPKLFESPDYIVVDGVIGRNGTKDVWFCDTPAYAFGYDQFGLVKGGQFQISKKGETHDRAHISRGTPYSGRIYTTYKIITFWRFPKNNEELKKVIEDLEKALKIKIWDDPEYKIEIIKNDNEDEKLAYKNDWVGVDHSDRVYIPLRSYMSSKERTPQEMMMQHLKAGKHEVPMGYGSKNPKYQEKRQWQMASVTDESFYPKLKEGVADKYAEKEFHIPDSDTEFDITHKSEEVKEREKDKIVFEYKGLRTFIIKNPTSLRGICEDARAVIDKMGNLFVLNINIGTHTNIIGNLVHTGEIEDHDTWWWLKLPINFVTIQRVGKAKFVLGESNEPMFPEMDKDKRERWDLPPYEECISFYQEFIDKAQSANPQYEFINKTYKQLQEEEKIHEGAKMDRYMQKSFGIMPDHNPEPNSNLNIVTNLGIGKERTPIVKNPKTLNDFQENVRAIADKDGNLYVALYDKKFNHGMMANALINRRIINSLEYDEEATRYVSGGIYDDQQNFLLLNRNDVLEEFITSDTFEWQGKDTEKIIKKVKEVNPQFKYYIRYYNAYN